jgi:hypothetical protein
MGFGERCVVIAFTIVDELPQKGEKTKTALPQRTLRARRESGGKESEARC